MGCFKPVPTAALVLLSAIRVLKGQELLPLRDVSISVGKLGSMVIPRLEESANLLVGGAVRFRNNEGWGLLAEGTMVRGGGRVREAGAGIYWVVPVFRDFPPPPNFEPYFLLGLDLYRSVAPLPASSSGITGGIGVKVNVGGNWFMSPEARVGLGSLRFSVAVGYEWSR